MCLLTVAQQAQLEAQEAAQQQQLIIIQTSAAEEEARRLEEERRRAEQKKACDKKKEVKKEVVRVTKTEGKKKVVVVCTSRSLSELHALRLRLEAAEGTLGQHVHICCGDDGMHNCGLKITQLQVDTFLTLAWFSLLAAMQPTSTPAPLSFRPITAKSPK